VSSSAHCGCDESRALRAVVTAGVSEKLDRLRAEAELRAREFAKHGQPDECLEWLAAARLVGGIR